MTIIQFALDEAVAVAAKQKAEIEGKSLEGWLADLVAQKVDIRAKKPWVQHIIEASERLNGNSGGKSWTREELYDE